ncbi:MAG: hypothetical protein ACE37K_12645 [Planctomycetota bacterium]
MRGELGQIDGVYDVYIRANVKQFSVRYEPDKVGVDQLLAALEAVGEPAKRK